VSEQELAQAVIAYLHDHHWDVYQEVRYEPAHGVADIVATQGKILAVIECKAALSLDVIMQAWRWMPFAHYVWIAVPKAKRESRYDGRWLGQRVCEERGIGVMTVRPLSTMDRLLRERPEEAQAECGFDVTTADACRAQVAARPSLQRRADVAALRATLAPEHKTFAPAGGRHGKRWSPYQATCADVRRYLSDHGGTAPLADVIAGIHHHYAKDTSAKQNLIHWIDASKVEGVKVDRSGRRLVLRLTSPPTEEQA
jgi:hypothetical protein